MTERLRADGRAGPNQGRMAAKQLRHRASAPRAARRLVRTICADAGLPTSLVDDAAVIAGELVTVSVRQSQCPVDVLVTVSDGEVRLRVHDSCTAAPDSCRHADSDRRGWDVARRLASSFGYGNGNGGRELWVLLRERRSVGGHDI